MVNNVVTKFRTNILYVTDNILIWNVIAHTPMPRVKIANPALTRITPDIAVTTELVVLLLRLSVFGLIRKPKWQATNQTFNQTEREVDGLNS